MKTDIAREAVEDFIKAYRNFSTSDNECPFDCGPNKLCIDCFGEHYIKDNFESIED